MSRCRPAETDHGEAVVALLDAYDDAACERCERPTRWITADGRPVCPRCLNEAPVDEREETRP